MVLNVISFLRIYSSAVALLSAFSNSAALSSGIKQPRDNFHRTQEWGAAHGARWGFITEILEE
jgi:hypothetical protein